MTSLQKHRLFNVVKCVSFLRREYNFIPSKSNLCSNGLYPILQRFKLYSVKRAIDSKKRGNPNVLTKVSDNVRREVQDVLLNYFHHTRSLQFIDAENMSRNTPQFFDKFLRIAKIDDEDVQRSLTRFLRYHPVNEFEPFFESIGLSPPEYKSFLPQNSILLHDYPLLLENYYVLCKYGIARNRIGNIYKVAKEIFQYDPSVLKSKLQSFENLGLGQSFIGEIMASSPYLLRGEINPDFLEVLERLKRLGIEYDWVEKHISDGDFYNWKCSLDVIKLFSEVGLREEQLRDLIKKHPGVLFEQSGCVSIYLIGFLLKFGFTKSQIQTLLIKFPIKSVVKFKNNLCRCYKFLIEIRMGFHDIGKIVHSYLLLFGSYEVKKIQKLLTELKCSRERLREIIMEEPDVLKACFFSRKVGTMSKQDQLQTRRTLRTNFLLKLGFVENSKEMEKALEDFSEDVMKLQERFDCLLNGGLSREEAIEVVKRCPGVIKLDKDLIEAKIVFFVNLGYPISLLVTYPNILGYSMERMKHRLLAYKWLREEGVLHSNAALSTIMAISDEVFMQTCVNSHPRGREFLERQKNEAKDNFGCSISSSARVDWLPVTNVTQENMKWKSNFLLNLGFVENSKEMEIALNSFWGKSDDIQERFDSLVISGVSHEDAIQMVKKSPQILKYSKDAIERKIRSFFDMGYSVSDLVTNPRVLFYTTERVKLRLLSYKWLKDECLVDPKLTIATLLSCSEKIFTMNYIDSNPRGREFWEKLKKEVYSE